MERSFLNPSTEPVRYARVLAPNGNGEFALSLGDWLQPTTETSFRHDSYEAAVDAYRAQVAQLEADGFIEIAPWLRYERGDEALEVLPPHVLPQVCTRVDGTIKCTECASFPAAIKRFNALVEQRIADGFVFRLPRHDLPPDEHFERVDEPDTEDPSQTAMRFWRSRSDADIQHGPQYW
ncbi:MAG: hypothetical protein AAF799_08055 [Myxococcota bacterium]